MDDLIKTIIANTTLPYHVLFAQTTDGHLAIKVGKEEWVKVVPCDSKIKEDSIEESYKYVVEW